jgi:hypothetical protein
MDSADFPESDLTRADRAVPERHTGADQVRSIHYPSTERPILADRAQPIAPDDPNGSPADLPASERRQAERRRIDRLSTDI